VPYTYSKVAVYAELGGALRLARSTLSFASDSVTGLPVNVTQGARVAPYLDTDANGIADFTAESPGPLRLTTGAVFVDVYSNELPGLWANASNMTTGTVADARLPVTARAATLSATYATMDALSQVATANPVTVTDALMRSLAADSTSGFSIALAAPSDSTKVSTFGDSLTDGGDGGVLWPETDSWPYKLGTILTGTTVTNLGFSSATVDELRLRVGAYQPKFTVVGASVPSSGDATLTTAADLGVVSWRAFAIDGELGPFAVTRTNLINNPRPAVDTNWNISAGTGGTAARSFTMTGGPGNGPFVTATWSVAPTGGAKSITVDTTGTAGQVVAGGNYVGSVWVKSSMNQTVSLDFGWYAAAWVGQTVGSNVVLVSNTWTHVSVTGYAPATATRASLSITSKNNPVAGESLSAAQGMLETGGTMRDFFDGASIGGTWTGAANASTSTIAATSTITGTFSRDAAGVLSFRTFGASPTTAAPSPVTFTPWTAGHLTETAVIWIGRNDLTFGITGPDASVADHIVGGTQRLVEWLTPRVKSVMILGMMSEPDEPSGSANHTVVTEVNASLRSLYPGKYASIQEYLRTRALADMGVTPTATDTSNIAAGTCPTSVFAADLGHISKPTAAAVAVLRGPVPQGKGLGLIVTA